MFGENVKRPPIKGDGSQLDIVDIFKTVQGEGPHSGTPSIFIRLGGCNLACSFCDTEFEKFTAFSIENIIKQVTLLKSKDSVSGPNLIVITGGEPLRQPIEKLIDELLQLDFEVQIESNGTIYRKLPEKVDIVCSPKVVKNIYISPHGDLINNISAFKFIISMSLPGYDIVPELGQTKFKIPVYVQPMDEYDPKKNQENMNLAIEIALKYNYKISLQTHKIMGIN